eukprot:CAMPEP_0184681256 /NCGR_PEP_ID=MMETSP0312-20130426/4218_1 /TAXON_ID=31354 /ORGANISM="Compsopogon coeruleus, Strain SAG 36.94" /LENGTH=36 /DNA_ID= /DNA_START= /DNA_END= /DNA_ORIENTATION=
MAHSRISRPDTRFQVRRRGALGGLSIENAEIMAIMD